MGAGDRFDAADSDRADSDLGGALREEWRADEEEYARAAAAQWTHGRKLVDIARELMHRGDTVALTIGPSTFTGTVVHVGTDVMRLQTPAGSVDVHLLASASGAGREAAPVAPLLFRVVERARAGGRRGGGGTDTFRARLLEHEANGTEVRLGALLVDEELRGLVSVGRDHVCVRDRDGRDTYVPSAWVGWVASWVE